MEPQREFVEDARYCLVINTPLLWFFRIKDLAEYFRQVFEK